MFWHRFQKDFPMPQAPLVMLHLWVWHPFLLLKALMPLLARSTVIVPWGVMAILATDRCPNVISLRMVKNEFIHMANLWERPRLKTNRDPAFANTFLMNMISNMRALLTTLTLPQPCQTWSLSIMWRYFLVRSTFTIGSSVRPIWRTCIGYQNDFTASSRP